MKNAKNNEQFIYLVHKDFFVKFLRQYGLKYSSIQNIIKNNNVEKFRNKLKEYINNNFKNKSNDLSQNNFESDLRDNKLEDYIEIKDNQKIYYYDNYFLLHSEILNILDSYYINMFQKMFPILDYYMDDAYCFLSLPDKGKKIIEIAKVNNNNFFQVEFIIDSSKDFKYITSILYKYKSKKNIYYSSFLFFYNTSDSEFYYFSPFFDETNNQIGNAYRIVKKKI